MPLKLIARRLLLALCLTCFTSLLFAQQKTFTGKITDMNGQPVGGATITVKGTTLAALTDDNGNFSISVPAGREALIVSYVGYETREIPLGAENNLSLSLKPTTTSLNEVVVTGYSTQKKKDIIGAVSVVNTEDLKSTPSANLSAQLQGRAAGVVVSNTGQPGSGAVVRIRGFQSFGNNNPLYIIDGVPTEDPSSLNPQDIESMQVLKDATASAVYGTRAANGVVIVTTKQGRMGKAQVSYDGYVGFQTITDDMVPDLLNTSQYMEYLTRSTTHSNDPALNYKHPVFGANGSFAVPDYIVVSSAFKGGVPAGDPKADPSLYSLDPLYQILKTTPEGTDWFDAVLRNGIIQSHQVTATGGTDKALYSVGLNYFDQEGVFKYTDYKRYTVRANTSFKPKSYFRFGENLQVSYEDRLGGDQRGEEGAWSWAYRMVPYIPLYDIKGGFGGNAVGESGNGSSPLATLIRDSDDKNIYYKLFGNVFAEVIPVKYLTARTSFGVDLGSQYQRDIARKTYERAENRAVTQLNERTYNSINWTWTNTLTFQKQIATDHDLKILVGTEAIKRKFKVVRASGQRFDFDNDDFIQLDRAGLLPGDRNVFNYNLDEENIPGLETVTISSLFARADYAYKGKYLLNATIRRDGASVFGPENRYANFPSVGVGWRISEEDFMKSLTWVTDLKLRAGWGEVGSIGNVRALNQYTSFTSTAGSTNYDIGGNNTSAVTGYRVGTIGNPSTKWETTESKNIGLDLTIFQGKWDFTFDYYHNDTKDLLVPKLRNGLEPLATQPQENIGTMRNSGFEISVNHHGAITTDLNYDFSLNFSHYKNELTKMNEEGTVRLVNFDRLNNALITRAGDPISSFYGYQIDGFYNTDADVNRGPKINGAPGTIGTWKYKDIDGDGDITTADRVILGSPHPDFQLGANLGLNWKNFDFNLFLFWNQGNKIYNYTKYYTDMRVFVGGVSTRVLNDTWTPQNTNAKLPVLQPGQNGFTSFVRANSNSYYVEDGSYLRAKNIQLGYTLPKSMISKIGMSNIRLYVQAQNLFTITNYSGPDPDLSVINNRVDDISTDTFIGVDRAGFPTPKQFLLGLNVSF
ncbi:TonB-dependent receptor [Chitinophagaceae bacterium LB-8]|uniref:TonB-dependent receptor n=1 Tax=Paraflavisolibacter caeni TaxID=2982496 RepID=A0A9X3BGP2_9BACT|nr:TonB-dependent receptor [Paraflavisolibacter caeni]MCU7547913.1 TonB-dependent receptor [Paraflavisolibacter caeni]